ncbi:MAG: hypothetical protein ICV53_08410 [Flavisolibacter sp.]|nr:hypothetical protein [Flavisolibacter sp.]
MVTHQRRTNILFILFLIGLIAFSFLLPKSSVVPVDYSRPASWAFDSIQIEIAYKGRTAAETAAG